MSEVLDLFQLTHVQSLFGQQVVNVYTYVLSTNTFGASVNAAAQLQQLWRIKFLNTDTEAFKAGCFVEDLLSMSVRAVNLYNPLVYSEYLDGTPAGTFEGNAMPTYETFSLRTPWLGPTIRRGFKRLAGVPEAYGNGGVLNTTTRNQLATFADAMNSSMSEVVGADEITFHPCIVKRVKYVTEEGKIAYRMPENAQEGIFDIVQDWQELGTLTTQNSRKLGYGA